MMLLPSDEEVKLWNMLEKCDNEQERQVILNKLKELAIEEDKELANCPFAH